MKKTSLPVDVRRSKTSLLKLPSNDDGDVNENGIKALGLDSPPKNNFARSSRFFVHFS